MKRTNAPWLAVMIGNSRLHWAWWIDQTLQLTWNTPHLPPAVLACLTQNQFNFCHCLEEISEHWATELSPDYLAAIFEIPSRLPLWIASVIPAQTPLWQVYPQTTVITLEQISISGLYPTLGIDRGLALLGTVSRYGAPSLVIDAGTALTFTGIDAHRTLVGGAILPGLQLQLRSLSEHTATLPYLSSQHSSRLSSQWPSRWTLSTSEAIWSGVLYTLLAGIQDFIQDWQHQHPEGAIVLTGGDANLILDLLKQRFDFGKQIKLDANLIFWGMQTARALIEPES